MPKTQHIDRWMADERGRNARHLQQQQRASNKRIFMENFHSELHVLRMLVVKMIKSARFSRWWVRLHVFVAFYNTMLCARRSRLLHGCAAACVYVEPSQVFLILSVILLAPVALSVPFARMTSEISFVCSVLCVQSCFTPYGEMERIFSFVSLKIPCD